MPDEGATAAPESPPSSLSTLGARIREIRGEQGITLAELSARAQVSVAMLSHLERGQAAPSLKTLDRLRVALDVPLTAFFQSDESEGSRTVVVRADRRARLPLNRHGLMKELLSPPGHSNLELFMLVLEPGGNSGPEPIARNGEKAGYVLEGRFELTVGTERNVLDPGDSFHFDARVPHRFVNLAPATARIIWIIKTDVAA